MTEIGEQPSREGLWDIAFEREGDAIRSVLHLAQDVAYENGNRAEQDPARRVFRRTLALCTIGLTLGGAAEVSLGERVGSAGPAEAEPAHTAAEQTETKFTSETIPERVPDIHDILRAVNGPVLLSSKNGQWLIVEAAGGSTHHAVKTWQSIGREIADIVAKHISVSEMDEDRLIVAALRLSFAPRMMTDEDRLFLEGLEPVFALIGGELDELFDEYEDDLTPFLELGYLADFADKTIIARDRRADMLNKLIAKARELGIEMIWRPNRTIEKQNDIQ